MTNQSIILNPDVESQRSGGPKTQRWKIGSTKWLAKLTSSTDSVESAWRISGNLSNYACLSFLFYSKIFTEKWGKYVCPFHHAAKEGFYRESFAFAALIWKSLLFIA